MPTEKKSELTAAPTTQVEVIRSLFRKTFDFGCFALLDVEKVPKGRKIGASKWVHTYKGDK